MIDISDTRDCPTPLDLYIAREVVDNVLCVDLKQFLQQETYPDEEPQLEASRLALTMFNTLYDICRRWSEHLPLEKMKKARMIIDVHAHAIKNTRRKMEDRHVALPYFNPLLGLKTEPECAFFGVYDGHGGVDAAVYAAAHVHTNSGRHEAFFSNPEEALKAGFLQTDQNFVVKAQREGLRSGTTGVSVLIQGRKLHVAWLGDSQAMMSRQGKAVQLMEPHKPEREDERKRIESMGGCVVYFGAWRVNGSLSVSRAIGDAEHKPYVWGQPDTATFDLDGTEEFIVLACDGLWDVLSRDRVIEVVTDHGSRDGSAKALVDEAKSCGSSDNITVIIAFLDGERQASESPPTTKALPSLETTKSLTIPRARPNDARPGKKTSAVPLGHSQSTGNQRPIQRSVSTGSRPNGKSTIESSSSNVNGKTRLSVSRKN